MKTQSICSWLMTAEDQASRYHHSSLVSKMAKNSRKQFMKRSNKKSNNVKKKEERMKRIQVKERISSWDRKSLFKLKLIWQLKLMVLLMLTFGTQTFMSYITQGGISKDSLKFRIYLRIKLSFIQELSWIIVINAHLKRRIEFASSMVNIVLKCQLIFCLKILPQRKLSTKTLENCASTKPYQATGKLTGSNISHWCLRRAWLHVKVMQILEQSLENVRITSQRDRLNSGKSITSLLILISITSAFSTKKTLSHLRTQCKTSLILIEDWLDM